MEKADREWFAERAYIFNYVWAECADRVCRCIEYEDEDIKKWELEAEKKWKKQSKGS